MPDEKRRFDPSMIGVVGQMLGGMGAGLGQSLGQKMNERMLVAAAALQGLIASDATTGQSIASVANDAREYADALLKELDEHPDPRYPKNESAGFQKVSDVIP